MPNKTLGGLALANGAGGRLVVFGIAGDGHLWRNTEDSTGRWLYWIAMGGPTVRQVQAEQNGDGNCEVFIVGCDQKIYHARETALNGAWTDWSPLGSPATQIAVARNLDGRLEVFALTGGLELLHMRQTTAMGDWEAVLSPPILVPGVQMIKAASNEDGRLELFGVTTEGCLLQAGQFMPGLWKPIPFPKFSRELNYEDSAAVPYRQPVAPKKPSRHPQAAHKPEMAGPHTHSVPDITIDPEKVALSWQTLVEQAGDFDVVRNQDGRLELFWDYQDRIWHIWQTEPNGNWSESAEIGGPENDADQAWLRQPRAALGCDGCVDLYALGGGDSDLCHARQTSPNGEWTEFKRLGLRTVGQIAVGRSAAQTLINWGIGIFGTEAFLAMQDGRVINSPDSYVSQAVPDSLTVGTGLPGAWVDEAYGVQMQASGGYTPYSWVKVSGGAPGMSVSASGVLSGTPSAAGLFELSVRCTDAAGTTAEQGLALAVQPARPPVIITPSPLQAATMGTPCLRPVAASGGKPPYSWSVSKGTLPPGLNINPLTGLIAGTPTTPATYTFSIQCMGSNGLHSETEFSLTVIPPTPPPANSMSIPLWGQGLTYTGCRPYVYTFTAMQHGHLQSIELPADNTTLNLPYINLVRYQKSSDDCRNPDAALTLARGQSTSDMKALFNVDNPLFAQAVHIVAWLPATGPQVASVSVIITYTD